MPTISSKQIESLGARIVRLASQTRVAPTKARVIKRGDQHEYVRDRARALALIHDHAEARAKLARDEGLAAGWVIGFRVFQAEQAPLLPRVGVRIGGGGDFAYSAPAPERSGDHVDRPTKRRGRPGRRGKLVAALARSRQQL